MKSSQSAQQPSTNTCRQLFGFLWQKRVPVPVLLLFILVLGTLAGIGFFMKNVMLQDLLAKIETENTLVVELQQLKMSNDWLKNRVSILHE